MKIIGYRYNQELYCINCTRIFCLDTLCSLLSDEEMTKLIPTSNLTTLELIDMLNVEGGDTTGGEILPAFEFDYINKTNNSNNGFGYSFIPDLCPNFHEFGHLRPMLELTIYQ